MLRENTHERYKQSEAAYNESVAEFISPTVSAYFPNFHFKTRNSLEKIKKALEVNWNDDNDSAGFLSFATSCLSSEANLLSAIAFFTETFADQENAFYISLYADLKGLIDEVLAEDICYSQMLEDSLQKRSALTELLDSLVGVVVNKGKSEDCTQLQLSIKQLEEQFSTVKQARMKAIVQRALIACGMLLLLATVAASFFIAGPLGIGLGVAAIAGFMGSSAFVSYKVAKSNVSIPKKSDIPAVESKLFLTPAIKACVGFVKDSNRFFNQKPMENNPDQVALRLNNSLTSL